jgi:D-sedoheptulose 7-phosphate isomerase
MGKKWGVLVAISGSGNSKNIIKAVNTANKIGMTMLGFTGFDGRELAKLIDYSIIVPSNDMRMIESTHSFVLHYIVNELVHET